MALICVGSVRAAPGASTLAVLLAGSWPRQSILMEADPDGGVLAPRYGLPLNPGLSGLAASVHQDRSAEAFWHNAQALPGDLPVIIAPTSADIATKILDDVAQPLADVCASMDEIDVVVDVGRVTPRSPARPLLSAADDVLLVARPRADELYSAAQRFQAIATTIRSVGLVLVGERPHSANEVYERMGVPVAGILADDPRGARLMMDGGSARALDRSPLARSVRSLAEDLYARQHRTLRASGPDGPESTHSEGGRR